MDTGAPTLRLVNGERKTKVRKSDDRKVIPKRVWLFHIPIEVRGGIDRYIEADTEGEALESFQKLDIWEWVQMWGVNSALTWDDEADSYSRKNAIITEVSPLGGKDND